MQRVTINQLMQRRGGDGVPSVHNDASEHFSLSEVLTWGCCHHRREGFEPGSPLVQALLCMLKATYRSGCFMSLKLMS